jgi:hypothetical protein
MDGPESESVMVAIKYEKKCMFTGLTLFFAILTVSHCLQWMEKCMKMGRLFSDGCGEQGNWVCMHNLFILAILPQQAWSMDASHSTGRNRVRPYSYGNGEQASEGMVVGMGLWGEQWTVLCPVWPMLMVGHFL